MSQPEAQATLLIDRAEQYLANQDFKSALPLLDQAVALEPDNLRAWGSRGLTHGNLKRYDEGLSDLDRLLQIEPNNRTGLYNKGLLLNELKRYDDAVAIFKVCTTFYPFDALAWHSLGVSYSASGRPNEALNAFDQIGRAHV